MIKDKCSNSKCNAPIPATKEYNDNYGNYCQDCNRKTGFYYTKGIKEDMIKTPLETDTIRRLRLQREAKKSEKLTEQMYQPAETEYLRLEKKVAEELRLLEIEKAHAQYSDLEIV